MCDIDSTNHSDDAVTVHFGGPAPLDRCGYHYARHGVGTPYATAILATTPVYGPRFTTSDGVALEWVTDMGTFESGYCGVEA